MGQMTLSRQPRANLSTAPPHEVVANDLLPDDQSLHAEMERLLAANRELLAGMGQQAPVEAVPTLDVEALRKENAELHACIGEMERAWLEREKEYEALLEEKSEIIRGLHVKLQESPARNQSADPAELDELTRLRKELEEQRRQLEQDEQDLMQQMRQMELAMSRERAEMARQRNEMHRLHADLAHEAEQTSRDSGLRERLLALRRQSEPPSSQAEIERPTVSQPTPPPKGSGLFRRIFGGGDA